MTTSNLKAEFACSVKKVWETVTSLTNYAWRSDISEIKILGDGKFVEITKDGYETSFTITAAEPYMRWEFDMDNSNMHGHWTGIFTGNDECCSIDFTESVEVKKIIMKPFIKSYLKKQQSLFVKDLQKALNS